MLLRDLRFWLGIIKLNAEKAILVFHKIDSGQNFDNDLLDVMAWFKDKLAFNLHIVFKWHSLIFTL